MRNFGLYCSVALFAVAAFAQPQKPGPADYCATFAQGGEQNAILQKTCEAVNKDAQGIPPFSFEQSTQRAQETGVVSSPGAPSGVVGGGMGSVGMTASAVQELIMAKANYSVGVESYHDFTINAHLTDETAVSSGGLFWTFSQLENLLKSMFGNLSPAQFKFAKQGNVKGKPVSLFTFVIPRAGNHGWFFTVDGKEFYPGVKGELSVDSQTGSVVHVKALTTEVDKDKQVPLRSVVVTADFDSGMLPDNIFPLPTKADVQYCRKDQMACLNNSMSFKNYHRLGSTASR